MDIQQRIAEVLGRHQKGPTSRLAVHWGNR